MKGRSKRTHKVAELISDVWQGVSETSLEAMQESFFQRLGKFTPNSLGWKLVIEKRTIDILLKRLPYGLGIIKFPWMKSNALG